MVRINRSGITHLPPMTLNTCSSDSPIPAFGICAKTNRSAFGGSGRKPQPAMTCLFQQRYARSRSQRVQSRGGYNARSFRVFVCVPDADLPGKQKHLRMQEAGYIEVPRNGIPSAGTCWFARRQADASPQCGAPVPTERGATLGKTRTQPNVRRARGGAG